ncbi:hypothetical protein JTE90_020100 [Oedothorax gibbosus]|uniref:Uncharacterized protein n=1 Tax=Oedothorax gibbosus TaxID=931172 RepID=A0AAV6VPR7_9ARAC|nr:hypothetical protein JTE90_020100 [Oedothorax gibbosus]
MSDSPFHDERQVISGHRLVVQRAPAPSVIGELQFLHPPHRFSTKSHLIHLYRKNYNFRIKREGKSYLVTALGSNVHPHLVWLVNSNFSTLRTAFPPDRTSPPSRPRRRVAPPSGVPQKRT